jgi:hypothetical protein
MGPFGIHILGPFANFVVTMKKLATLFVGISVCKKFRDLRSEVFRQI